MPSPAATKSASRKLAIEHLEDRCLPTTLTVVPIFVLASPRPPVVFNANHSFLYLIRDNQSGSILFMGQVTNPTQTGGNPSAPPISTLPVVSPQNTTKQGPAGASNPASGAGNTGHSSSPSLVIPASRNNGNKKDGLFDSDN